MLRRSPEFALFLTALLALVPRFCRAQTTEPTEISQTHGSLLRELNHETQTLFKQVSPSIVRVQLPLPTFVSLAPDDPLSKWYTRLDPVSRAKLEDLQRRAPGTSFASAEMQPTTSPSQPGHVFILRLERFSPNGIGIVLDDQNHILVPRYVDKDACQMPVPVALGDGRWTTATFVASDLKTDLTILQLSNTKTKPAAIAPEAPSAGALLLVMSLNPASNRLAVWEGWEPDVATLVNIDGTVAGFSKGGHYISAAACEPLASELIDHGYVHRPVLGVWIQTVPSDDPQRQMDPVLGATPAIRITQVIPSTPAAAARLQPGDLILSLAGQTVADAADFAAAIADRRGKTSIIILRNDVRQTVSVDLQAQ